MSLTGEGRCIELITVWRGLGYFTKEPQFTAEDKLSSYASLSVSYCLDINFRKNKAKAPFSRCNSKKYSSLLQFLSLPKLQ